MPSSKFKSCTIGLAFWAVCAAASAAAPDAPDMSIDAAMRTKVIATLSEKFAANYVFPDVAAKMTADVRARAQRGEYDKVASANAFADLLSAQMQAISHDKHVRIMYSQEPVPPDTIDDKGEPKLDSKAAAARDERMSAFGRSVNFGFEKYERLDANIAYLEMRGFFDAAYGGVTATAMMNNVANADALIIDLRRNGGGDPAMVALVSSYLFDQESVHLNDLYHRSGDRTTQYWTQPFVSGPRFGKDKPVYILTSARTFSAAEEFCYDLKNLKRATIVGETTGGGANPGDDFQLAEHFASFIPTGRAVNPVTHTNWEGTGVQADVAVPADQALLTAQLMAMKPLVEKAKDPQAQAHGRGKMEQLQAALNAMRKK
jgi:retinol-binding protein 3